MSQEIIAVAKAISNRIDKTKKGEKIDRKKLAADVQASKQENPGGVSLPDVETLVGIVCRQRDDLETVKGVSGGTFKR